MNVEKLRHTEVRIFSGHLWPGTVHRLITAWPVGLCRFYISASQGRTCRWHPTESSLCVSWRCCMVGELGTEF